MPSRRHLRDLSGVRCRACWLRTELCVCGAIPKLTVTTKLVLLMHAAEVKSTSNTGRLAALAFEKAEIRVRGKKDQVMTTEGIVADGSRGLLLYPDDDAVLLNEEFVSGNPGPYTLIVPDGTWRQASKVARREPGLASIQRVKLPEGPPSKYKLRVAPQAHSLSTIEAIARTIGVLEGREHQEKLETLFRLFVTRSLWSRGMLPLSQCEGLIPPEAVEAHHLRSNGLL